jgi:type I restriction enzyme S subunit
LKWPAVSLAEALSSAEVFVDGDWVETKDQDPAGDVRLIQLADVGDGEYIDKSARFLTSTKARQLRCTFLRQGDILVARMPNPLGRACIFPGDAKPSVTVVDVCIIRPNGTHNRRWLMHCLNAPLCRNQIASFATGTTRSRISRGNLAKIRIPLLPLAEQRRIADVLDQAEALRAKRRAALAQVGSLTQSLFLDFFGDPAANPKGWPVRVIGDLLESASYGTSEKSASTGQFPVLRMNNITRTGEMDFTDLKFMELPEALHERYLVRAGDVLFNRTNSADLVGKSGVYRESKPMAYAGYLIRLRVTKDNDPEFLACFLNTDYSKRMLRGMCKSIIGMANINATEIQKMKIPHPPIELQREFARRVAAVEKLKAAQRASLAEVDALFASLRHRAFRGEL